MPIFEPDPVMAWVRSASNDLTAPGLPQSLQDLKAALVQKKQNIEHQLALRKTDLQAFHSECLLKGDRGKREYFEEKTRFDDWKNSANYVKSKIEQRIALVKSEIRKSMQASPTIQCPNCGYHIDRAHVKLVAKSEGADARS
jgi:hypothetical protein